MLFKKFSENNILRLLSSGNSVFKFLKISESVLFAPKDDNRFPQSFSSVKGYTRHPLVLAADGFKSVILASCVPSTNPAFFRAQAALCLAAHSAQLFSASEVRVSVALYVILPHSHTHSHRRTFLFPRVINRSERPITVSFPICCPVKSRSFLQPQLVVWPLVRFVPSTILSFPQSQRQSQYAESFLHWGGFSALCSTRSLPNRWPLKSFPFTLVLTPT